MWTQSGIKRLELKLDNVLLLPGTLMILQI